MLYWATNLTGSDSLTKHFVANETDRLQMTSYNGRTLLKICTSRAE